jgi:hypothetical protein
MNMRRLAIALITATLVTGCKQPGGPYPSLQPRAAEGIDPRLDVGPLTPAAAVSPSLAAQLAELVATARAGNGAFGPAMAEAERRAAAAGAPQTESWVVAQQALSAAIAARAPTMRALGDIDAIAARQLEERGTIPPADLAAVQDAAAAAGALSRSQQARIDAAAGRLGR